MKTKKVKQFTLSLVGLMFGLAVMYSIWLLFGVDGSGKANQVLEVSGVPNRVEILKSLTITGDSSSPQDAVTLSYTGTHLAISGTVNIDSMVVGSENRAWEASAVFGGTGNQALGTASAIVGGNRNEVAANVNNSVVVASNQSFVKRGGVDSSEQGSSSNSFIAVSSGSQLWSSSRVALLWSASEIKNANNVFVAGDNVNYLWGDWAVILGKNLSSTDTFDKFFVYSNADQNFSLYTGNAFYVNALSGIAINKTSASTALDLNGGLVLTEVTLWALTGGLPIEAKGTMALVKKGNKTGLCGWDGKVWVPLTPGARKGLCVEDVKLGKKPINDAQNSSQSATVVNAARNRSDVTTKQGTGPTDFPQIWNNEKGIWEKKVWTYNTNLWDGEYVCGTGYHTSLDNPNGAFTGNCIACSYIENMYSWRGHGTNNNCPFTCKAGYKYNASERSCTACGSGFVISQEGHQQASCTKCNIQLPQNAHYSTFNTCNWECDPGYVEVNGRCEKPTWVEKRIGQSCQPGGRLYQGYEKYTTVCQTSDGIERDQTLCTTSRRTPEIWTGFVYMENCNQNQWNCPEPNCSSAGECGGFLKKVLCTAPAKDPAGKDYTAEKEEQRPCRNSCKYGQCGTIWIGNQMVDQLSRSSTGLCATWSSLYVGDRRLLQSGDWIADALSQPENAQWGRIDSDVLLSGLYFLTGTDLTLSFSPKNRYYTWFCKARDGISPFCMAQKRRLEDAQCGEAKNQCKSGEFRAGTPRTGESARWSCDVSDRQEGTSVLCIMCASDYHKEGARCVKDVTPTRVNVYFNCPKGIDIVGVIARNARWNTIKELDHLTEDVITGSSWNSHRYYWSTVSTPQQVDLLFSGVAALDIAYYFSAGWGYGKSFSGLQLQSFKNEIKDVVGNRESIDLDLGIACEYPNNHSCIGIPPENATLLSGDDTFLPYDTQITLVSENTDKKCEYICDSGFHKEGNQCVLNERAIDCRTEPIPQNAEYLMTQTRQTFQSWDDAAQTWIWAPLPPVCEWTCKTGFKKEGNKCVSNENLPKWTYKYEEIGSCKQKGVCMPDPAELGNFNYLEDCKKISNPAYCGQTYIGKMSRNVNSEDVSIRKSSYPTTCVLRNNLSSHPTHTDWIFTLPGLNVAPVYEDNFSIDRFSWYCPLQGMPLLHDLNENSSTAFLLGNRGVWFGDSTPTQWLLVHQVRHLCSWDATKQESINYCRAESWRSSCVKKGCQRDTPNVSAEPICKQGNRIVGSNRCSSPVPDYNWSEYWLSVFPNNWFWYLQEEKFSTDNFLSFMDWNMRIKNEAFSCWYADGSTWRDYQAYESKDKSKCKGIPYPDLIAASFHWQDFESIIGYVKYSYEDDKEFKIFR